MKCGRLRFSNCFVVFFPFSQVLSPFTFLRSTESSFSSRRSLSLFTVPVPYNIYHRISIPWLSPIFSSFSSASFALSSSSSPFWFLFYLSWFLHFFLAASSSFRHVCYIFCFFVSFLRASLLIIRSIHTILSLYNLAFPCFLTFWFMNFLRIFFLKKIFVFCIIYVYTIFTLLFLRPLIFFKCY